MELHFLSLVSLIHPLSLQITRCEGELIDSEPQVLQLHTATLRILATCKGRGKQIYYVYGSGLRVATLWGLVRMKGRLSGIQS